jgi:MFS family permease
MPGQALDSSHPQTRPTRARHAVLGLIVALYVITYMDRVNISSAMPVLQRDLGISIVTVGWIFSSFRWGYALFQIPGGWFGDKIGPRRALAAVVCWWSLFTSLTAVAWSASSIGLVAFCLGSAKRVRFRSQLAHSPAGCRPRSEASRRGFPTPPPDSAPLLHLHW